MNETKPPVPQTPQSDIAYQVMPQSDRPNFEAPTPPPAHSEGGGGSKAAYIIIMLIVLGLLAALAWYFLGGLGTKKTDTTSNTGVSKLQASFLSMYFAKDVCDDELTCGDNADPDLDGLTNYQEFVADTNPTLADTDSDGIADGDEVDIYLTMPKDKYTDNRSIAQQNDFNDGASIKNGYDPTTPGVPFTETRLAKIKDSIAQFGLHAPTTTTLKLNSDGTPASASNGTSVNPAAGGSVTPNPTGTPDGTQ